MNLKTSLVLLGLISPFTYAADNPFFVEKMRNPTGYSTYTMEYSVETICGTDDLQHIESYNGTHQNIGFDFDKTERYGTSVGAMKRTNVDWAQSYCSGTLIDHDLFITASHCVDATTPGQFVSFGYQTNAGNGQIRGQFFSQIQNVVEDGAAFGLDYAILRIGGQSGYFNANFPGATGEIGLGWKDLDESTPNAAMIIQHPLGQAKQVDAGTGITTIGNHIRYSDIDTQGGSSGSGVLNQHGEIVGIHTNGGCTTNSGANFGVSASRILDVSNVISSLAPVSNVDVHLRRTGWTNIDAPLLSGLFSYTSPKLYNHEVDKDNNSRSIRWTRPAGSATQFEYLIDFGPTGRTANLTDTQWTSWKTVGGSSTRPSDYLNIAGVTGHALGTSSLLPYLPRTTNPNSTEYVKIHFRMRNVQNGNVSSWRYIQPIWYYYND